jgi:hypothetical protein
VLSLAIRAPLSRDSPGLHGKENPGRADSFQVGKAPARYTKLDSFPAEYAPMIENLEAAAFAGREELQTNGPPAKVSRWRQVSPGKEVHSGRNVESESHPSSGARLRALFA